VEVIGCVHSDLCLGMLSCLLVMFYSPTLHHRCLRQGWSLLLAGRLLPSRHLPPSRILVRPLRHVIWSVVEFQCLPLSRDR
jgi:hypothetical protein